MAEAAELLAWVNKPLQSIDRILRAVRNLSLRTCSGWVAEAAVVRMIRQAGVPIVRCMIFRL